MPVVEDANDAKEKFMKSISGADEQLTNLIALNTALAFYISDQCVDMKQGYEKARELINNGTVVEMLNKLKES
jgi:anthranilate phosphoribosyltransferase